MKKIFRHFSKGRRFLFTSSQCQRVRKMVGAGGCQRWSMIKTTKPMTTSSPRLWARWRTVGAGQILGSTKRLFLLTVKVLIRVQERSNAFIFVCLSSNYHRAAKCTFYALHCISLIWGPHSFPVMHLFFCKLYTHKISKLNAQKYWKGYGSKITITPPMENLKPAFKLLHNLTKTIQSLIFKHLSNHLCFQHNNMSTYKHNENINYINYILSLVICFGHKKYSSVLFPIWIFSQWKSTLAISYLSTILRAS